ncbi:FTR1 family protein [Methanococcoides methylutens]|uniref:Putative cytochrome n=1 Tax=Methanococcoides methylutens MM1 TaxID=1434104 RepID=A0A0E3WZP0_METMT|nr:FTR1 family protein [Methanococcoides methylutens]AKB85225.1 Putative cytochrome [Methanococcoides methylutens MM1]
MFSSFMITFREGLEAFLIVGIILAYLVQTRRTELNKYVYGATGLAIVGSLAAAVVFNLLSIQFEGRNEELFEGIVMLVAAVILTSMIIWMARESNNISTTIQEQVEGKKAYGLFGLAFLSVFREGIETVLFLGAAAMNTETNAVLYGGIAGLSVSVVVAYLVFKYSSHTSMNNFFKVTSIFLILFAAGLAAHGVHELQEAGVVPIVVEHVWDINHIIDEKGTFGSVMKSLFGYNGNPSLIEVLTYAGYYIAVGIGLRMPGRREKVAITA